MLRSICLVAVLAFCSPLFAEDDIKTGPEAGAVPELKVYDTTGPNTGSEVDYVADRKGKPTVYVFIAADKWDRPVARFLKELDTAVGKESDDAYLVAVWLTDDAEKTKAYLPKAQMSISLQRSALTCFLGDKAAGPKNWNINADAHVTAVVSTDGKVVKNFGYRSVNETDVPAVKEALAKAIKK
jgi:hypothetical protein